MIGYCEYCKTNDKLYKNNSENFYNYDIYGTNFQQTIQKVICLNCGSESLFTFELVKIDLIKQCSKNLNLGGK